MNETVHKLSSQKKERKKQNLKGKGCISRVPDKQDPILYTKKAQNERQNAHIL